MTRPINAIVIHCAATPNGDKRFTVGVIDRMHGERKPPFMRNAGDIAKYAAELGHSRKHVGYHWIIEADGTLSRGRHPEEVGAHVAGNNARTLGICLIGTDKFAPAQWETLRTLVKTLQAKYPGAAVRGHRDYSPDKDGDGVIESFEWIKICPGFSVEAWMEAGKVPEKGRVL